jgi:UDP-glucuronate 4-epimerase
MKILVTGAAGFIGSHLSERLAALGHEVTGVDSFNPYYSRELKERNVADIKKKGVQFAERDLVTDDLSGIAGTTDVVFHLAAQPGISDAVPFENFKRNNIDATYALLEACRKNPKLKMFVNIATSSVYGRFADGNEETAPKPTSYYGVTKLAAEQLALAYYRDKGLPVSSARLFSVYGERERPEKMYTKLIKSIAEGIEFPLYEGSELHKRSYTYVGDIVDGFVAMLDHLENIKGEIFNFGTEKVITTAEGISIVEEIMGKKAKIIKVPKRAGDQQETSAVIDKARRVLGYNPITTPREGLRKQVEWYKSLGLPGKGVHSDFPKREHA